MTAPPPVRVRPFEARDAETVAALLEGLNQEEGCEDAAPPDPAEPPPAREGDPDQAAET